MCKMEDEVTFKIDYNITRYNALAAVTFLAYDMLLLLPLEVRFVWKQRWSGGKLLYTWNRLFGFSTVVINTTAYFEASLAKTVGPFFPLWQGISVIVAVMTIECLNYFVLNTPSINTEIKSSPVILQARVFAVYEGNKKLLFIMAGSFLVTLGLTLFLLVKYMSMYIESYATSLKWYPYLWVPSLVFETFLCLLMVVKAVMLYRREVSSPLLIVLIRDSILYFVIVLTTLLANCIGSYLRPSAVGFGLSWVIVVPCALCSRLLLNMRREYLGGREHFNQSSIGTALSGWRAAPIGSGVLSSVVLSASR